MTHRRVVVGREPDAAGQALAQVFAELRAVAGTLDFADLHCIWRCDNANPVVRAFTAMLLEAGPWPHMKK